jgi:hypothetical protein
VSRTSKARSLATGGFSIVQRSLHRSRSVNTASTSSTTTTLARGGLRGSSATLRAAAPPRCGRSILGVENAAETMSSRLVATSAGAHLYRHDAEQSARPDSDDRGQGPAATLVRLSWSRATSVPVRSEPCNARKALPEIRASSAAGCLRKGATWLAPIASLVPSIQITKACCPHPGRLLHRRQWGSLDETAVLGVTQQQRRLPPVAPFDGRRSS